MASPSMHRRARASPSSSGKMRAHRLGSEPLGAELPLGSSPVGSPADEAFELDAPDNVAWGSPPTSSGAPSLSGSSLTSALGTGVAGMSGGGSGKHRKGSRNRMGNSGSSPLRPGPGGGGSQPSYGQAGASPKAAFRIRSRPMNSNPTPVVPSSPSTGNHSRFRTSSIGSDGAGAPNPAVETAGAGAELDQDDSVDLIELDDALSRKSLLRAAGADDVDSATHLEMRVDSNEMMVCRIGIELPELRSLKLNDSVLSSFRDLGTAFSNLQVLWLNRSGIVELDGVNALRALKELYLGHNNVEDLSPLAMHDTLEILDLEANNVYEMDQVEVLGTCDALVNLNLSDNPVATVDQYRRLVRKCVPRLSMLDDKEVTAADSVEPDAAATDDAYTPRKAATRRRSSKPGSGAGDSGMGSDSGALLAELQADDGGGMSLLDEGQAVADRMKGGGAGAAAGGGSGGNAAARDRAGSGGASASAAAGGGAAVPKLPVDASAGSELTSGTAFVGTPAMAVRRRKARDTGGARDHGDAAQSETGGMSVVDTLDYAAVLDKMSKDEVVAELRNWDLEAEVAKLKANPSLRAKKANQRPGTAGAARTRGRRPMPINVSGGGAAHTKGVMGTTRGVGASFDAGHVGLAGMTSDSDDGETPKALSAAEQRAKLKQQFREFSRANGPVVATLRSSGAEGSGSGSGVGGASESKVSDAAATKPTRRPTASERPPSAPPRGSSSSAGSMASTTASVSMSALALHADAGSSGVSGGGATSTPTSAGSMGIGLLSSRSGGSGGRRFSGSEDGTQSRMSEGQSSFGRASVDGASDGPSSRPGTAGSRTTGSDADGLGDAVFAHDDDLVAMLRKKPKHVPELRSREGFRRFFRGVDRKRMSALLDRAYEALEDGERAKRVAKRLSLVAGVLAEDLN